MKQLRILLSLIPILGAAGLFAQAGAPDAAFGSGDGFTTTTFLPGGHAYPNALAIQPNGRIVVAGGTWIPGSNSQIALARYMPNGSPDPTFDGDGRATLVLTDLSCSLEDLLILPDGKILGVGGVWSDTEESFLLARFNADGTPDNTFDGDGTVITHIGLNQQYGNALAVQSDGKIIIAGYANMNGYEDVAILRYKANGTLDNTFGGGDGIVTMPVGESYSSIQDIKIQPDGKIVAAGYGIVNGYDDFAIMRFNNNGTPDNSFSGDGLLMMNFTSKKDEAQDIALQPDGKILVAGYAGAIGVPTDVEMVVARLTPGGIPDNTFDNDGMVTIHASDYSDRANKIVLQPDGKILVGGSARPNANEYHFAVARLMANGQPDASFHNNNGISTLAVSGSTDVIQAMALQQDGKVVAAGNAWFNGYNQFAVARFVTGLTVGTNIPLPAPANVAVYPNPVPGQATLTYELENAEMVEISLYDETGRFVQQVLRPTAQSAGTRTEQFRLDPDLPTGHYLLVLTVGDQLKTIKIIIE